MKRDLALASWWLETVCQHHRLRSPTRQPGVLSPHPLHLSLGLRPSVRGSCAEQLPGCRLPAQAHTAFCPLVWRVRSRPARPHFTGGFLVL